MLAYAGKRLLGAIPLIFIGLTLTFFIIHWAPGDPVALFVTSTTNVQAQEVIVERFGLDQPVFVQYLKWLERVVLHFDFGNSFHSGRPAARLIRDVFPATLLLTGLALLLGWVLGLALGVVSALYHDRGIDRVITTVVLFFYSMPGFWIGLMLLSIFAIKLDWLPASQLKSVFHSQLGAAGQIWDYVRHLFLPVLTLGLTLAAIFHRYTRTSMIEALNADYLLAARARGVPRRKIIWKYGLKNASIPLISLLGLIIPELLSGVIVIETIFSLPGMGRVMVEAVLGRDYPVIMAASTLAFIAVIAGNFLADIGYALVDPRIRLE